MKKILFLCFLLLSLVYASCPYIQQEGRRNSFTHILVGLAFEDVIYLNAPSLQDDLHIGNVWLH